MPIKMLYNVPMKILSNKWFWIAIITIILIVVLNRNWYKIKRLFQPSTLHSEPNEGPLTEDRQQELESIASALYNSIYGSHDNEAYERALNLTDTELKYMSKFYRRQITQGNWLYTDIDDEIFSPWNDRDKRLMAKLAAIGEKG